MTVIEDKPDQGPAPHAKEATLRWRVALVAVVAASLTAAATLVGNIIASNVVADTAKQSFLRTQRQTAYSEFLFASYAMNPEIQDYFDAGLKSDIPIPELEAARTEYNTVTEAWLHDYSVILLVGSPEMKAQTLEIYEHQKALGEFLDKQYYSHFENRPKVIDMQPYSDGSRAIEEDIQEFVDLASAELTG